MDRATLKSWPVIAAFCTLAVVGLGFLTLPLATDAPSPAESGRERPQFPNGDTESPHDSQPDPIDLKAVRQEAWERIQPHIAGADKAIVQQVYANLTPVSEFFTEKKAGTREFAEAVLSLKGKWEFVRSQLPYADSDRHYRFLSEKFEECVFATDDLKRVVEVSIEGYVSEIRGIENQLLVTIRADLNKSDLPISKIGRTRELLKLIGKHGDRAMDFVWKHKGALIVSAALVAFLADPEPFIDGTRDITTTAAESVIKPIADVPKEIASEAARRVNWTLIALFSVFVAGSIAGGAIWLKYRTRMRRSRIGAAPVDPEV